MTLFLGYPFSGFAINLSWTNNDPTANVEIDRSTSPSGPFIPLSPTLNPGVTTYSDTGLTAGTTYYYQAKAVYYSFSSNPSNTASDTTQSLTSSFAANSVNTGAIDVTWNLNVSTSNVSNIELDRSTSPDGGFTAVAPSLAGNTIFYMDEDPALTEGTQYFYRLLVTESAGTQSSPVIDAWTVPAAPSDMTAAAVTGSTIALSWLNNSVDAIGFQIDRAGSDGIFNAVGTISGTYAPGATVDYTDTTATAETTYTYQVWTIGHGGYSDTPAIGDPVTSGMAAPSALSVVPASSSQMDLTWTNNTSLATGIAIDRSTDGVNFTTITSSPLDPSTTSYADTDLAEGTHYWYRVRAVTDSATSDPASADADTDAAVDTLTANPASTTEIDLSWNLNTISATAIEVDRYNGTAWTVVSNTLGGTQTSYNDTGLTENATYTYRVRAVEGASNSAYTQLVTASTLAAISGLSATPGSTDAASEIDLSWTLNIDPTTVDHIQIDRSTSATGTFTSVGTVSDPATTTTFSDTGLAESTDYFYHVYAMTASGASEEIATTDATTGPAADTLAATAASTSEIDLTWNLNVTDATAIEVDRSTDGGTTWTMITNSLSGTAISYNDTGLNDNTDYFYKVGAVRPGGDSAFTDPTDAITVAAVSALTATPYSTARIDLAWTTNITTPTSIEIARSTDGTTFTTLSTTSLAATATSYSDTTVSEGVHYYYKVKVSDASGAYNFSDAADAWTTSIQNLAATPYGTTEINLSWSNLSTNATAIQVDRFANGGNSWTTLTSTLYGSAAGYADYNGLTSNTNYTYRVRAIEPGGAAPFTDSLDAWTLPVAPSNLSVTHATPTEINLSWINNDSSATSFYIERSDDSGVTFSIIDMVGAGVTTYADTTVTDGTSYAYQVDAASGDGVNDNPDTTTSAASVPLIAPTDLVATANGQTEIDLSWTNTSETATGYVVERSVDGSNFTQIGTVDYADDTFYSDTTATAGTQYCYQVRATASGIADSGPSTICNVATSPSFNVSLPIGSIQGGTTTLTTQVLYAAGSVDPAGSGWNINWGDGTTTTSTNDPGSFDHVYAQPGAFAVVASTNNGSYTTTLSANVSQASGTLLLADNTTEPFNDVYFLEPGTTYQLTATADGDHLLRWVVDWGDGNSQTYDAASSTLNQTDYTQTFTHDYSVEGSFIVSVAAVYPDGMLGQHTSFSSYSNDPGYSGGYYDTLYTPSNPTVTSPADQVVAVGSNANLTASYSGMAPGSTPVAFVTWNGMTKLMDLTADSDTSGTLTATFADVQPSVPGDVIPPYASITVLDANAFGALYASNPYIAASTFQGESPPNTIFPGPDSAHCNIYVWGLTYGTMAGNGSVNSSGGPTLQASQFGLDYLQPLTIVDPRSDLSEAAVTLSTSDAADANVWADNSPSLGDTPLLGETPAGATVQTAGLTIPAGATSVTVYVGGTNLQTAVGGITLAMSAPTTVPAPDPPATTQSSTAPPASTQPNVWTQVSDAIAKRDWAAATKLMRIARDSHTNPTDGKQPILNVLGHHLHIKIRLLGKTANFFEKSGENPVKIPYKDLGLPDFPGDFLHPGKSRSVFIAPSTLVRLVDIPGGADTGAYRLIGSVHSVSTYDDGKEPTILDKPQDFGMGQSLFPNSLFISYAGNWYIDTAAAISDNTKRRFFQMHVTVEDANGNVIPGVEAWYGFAFWVIPDPNDFSKSRVVWRFWGQTPNRDVTDPDFHIDNAKILDYLQKEKP